MDTPDEADSSNEEEEVDHTVERLAAMNGGLFTVDARLGPNQVRAKATLDCAASKVYLSTRKSKQLPRSLFRDLPPARIVLPNGQEIVSTQGVLLPYQIGSWTDTVPARIIDIEGFDLILGLKWF